MPVSFATQSDIDAINARIDALEGGSSALDGPFVDTTEDVFSLPINGGHKVMMSVPATVTPADLVLLLGQIELTNPYSFNVGFGRYVTRGASPTDLTGPRLVPANMDNITPGMHHKSEDFWAVDTGGEGTFYYNIVGYAAASGGSGNVTVEQGYGKLSVLVFRR